jgi:tRNA A37 threonylcarbamoyladenosine biosynthesis protein TsaE
VHEYRAPDAPVVHVDLYRLESAAQLPQIGWDDFTRSGATVLVEWPERVPEAIPRSHLALRLEHIADRADLRRLSWPG